MENIFFAEISFLRLGEARRIRQNYYLLFICWYSGICIAK